MIQKKLIVSRWITRRSAQVLLLESQIFPLAQTSAYRSAGGFAGCEFLEHPRADQLLPRNSFGLSQLFDGFDISRLKGAL
jgi:hypothetical protein